MNNLKTSHVNTLVFKPLYNYLKSQNVRSAEEILNTAGITLSQLGSNVDQCSVESYYNAFHAAMKATDDPLLGLHIGEWMHPSNMGLLGYAILNCETMKEAFYLVLSANLYGFGNETLIFDLSFEGDDMKMTMSTEWDVNIIRPWIEMTTAGWISTYHHLTNFTHRNRKVFKQVAFEFPAKGREAEYERVLGCPVLFDQPEAYIVADAAVLDQEIYTADKNSLQVFMDQLGIQQGKKVTLVDDIRERVKKSLPNVPTGEMLAKQYGFSLSTFKRRLSELNTSYNDICLTLKMDMAKEMLLNNDISINEIAYYLGYSKPSAFFRLFKRLEGITPKQFKESHSAQTGIS